MSFAFPSLRISLTVSLLGLSLAAGIGGCSKDSGSSGEGREVCNGILKDGHCLAICDAKLDCNVTTQVCVRESDSDPGACYNLCANNTGCPAGTVCGGAPSTTALVCVPRVKVPLPAGSGPGTYPTGTIGAACTKPTDCDDGHFIVCAADGHCRGSSGSACATKGDCDTASGLFCHANGQCGGAGGTTDPCKSDAECDASAGLSCHAGKCAPPGVAGDPCARALECDATAGLACLKGKCAPFALPGEECVTTGDCDATRGTSCVEGVCLPNGCIADPGTCPPGFQCQATTDGAGKCAKSTVDNALGHYGTHCPHGPTDCTDDFKCIGVVADQGAFCTKLDGCAADTDCPTGFWCGQQQALDSTGHILLGQGKRACEPRLFCAPCETDFDCSGKTGGICVPDVNGEKFCSFSCAAGTNACAMGVECVDVGGGVNACRPDVGFCHAKEPVGCSPCRNDLDCGPNGACMDGTVYSIPGINYCTVPCGPPDANGKKTCPLAPNGEEMICFDNNLTTWGSETIDGTTTKFSPVYQDHCMPNWVTQNLPLFPGKDPPKGVCGNGRREGTEECDDGNPSSNDGCSKCVITDKCRFIADAGNGDDALSLKDKDGVVYDKVPAGCKTFLVEGDIEAAGDIDSFTADIESGGAAYVDVFTDKVGSCNADLKAELREGTIDLTVPCHKLVAAGSSVQSQTTLCKTGNLSCGPCVPDGTCGVCDDDGGVGDCPRFVADSTIYYYQYSVDNTSVQKTFRVYANDPKVSGVHYLFLVSHGDVDQGHQFGGEDFPSAPPSPACFY